MIKEEITQLQKEAFNRALEIEYWTGIFYYSRFGYMPDWDFGAEIAEDPKIRHLYWKIDNRIKELDKIERA